MARSLNHDFSRNFFLWPFFALCFVVSTPAIAQSQSDNPKIAYQIKRGDTLIELANKYFRKVSDYRVVQRINRIRNPRLISVGKKITIPFHILKYRKSEASLSAFRGNVSIASDGRNLKPVKGLDIAEGSRLTTAAGSFLTLQLEDGSRVSMPSNSKVRVTRLRHILLTDSVDYELSVESGRLRSKITPFGAKPGRYRVRTPVSVSAVRGTDYRTRVDEENGAAFSETVEGEIDVAAGGISAAVPQGNGARASESGSLAKAELLTPPALVDPAKIQSEENVSFEIASRAMAVGHRVVVSSDAGFVDIVADQQDKGNLLSISDLPNGRYFAKATAISNDGFEGMPANYSFKRVLNTLSGSAEQGEFGFKFKWVGEGSGKRLYRFQLLRGSKTAVPIIDEAAMTVDSLTLSDLPDGEYFWRVGVTQFVNDDEDSISQKWTEFEKLTVAG